jgi:Rrf2 family nitric oxide-sensitive transcriptional repressor
MRLSAFTDYSLRTLIYLASQPGRRATIAEIAGAFEVSENHLTKVVHFLAKHGWIESVRGRGGGLRLGKPPAEIVIGRVVRDTEGPIVAAECFDADAGAGHRCSIAPVCHLRGVLAEAVAAFHGVLDRYTLADLVSNPQQLARVLFLEPHPS